MLIKLCRLLAGMARGNGSREWLAGMARGNGSREWLAGMARGNNFISRCTIKSLRVLVYMRQ
jgi:hypothetical protein